jgi:hypothetical protein
VKLRGVGPMFAYDSECEACIGCAGASPQFKRNLRMGRVYRCGDHSVLQDLCLSNPKKLSVASS